MRSGKVSVILFLFFLVVVLVSTNVYLYNKLQYNEKSSEPEGLVIFKVRSFESVKCLSSA